MVTSPMRFETLMARHHDEIYGYLWRVLRSAGRADAAVEAQDLTQDVFLRAYQAFGRLRPDSNHRAWLYKIATNCAYTALKQGQRRSARSVPLGDEVQQVPAPAGQSPEHQLDRSEELAVVRRAIVALPPKQQMAVVLRHVQGLDYAAVAQALNCSEDSARANVYQALRRLRQTLADEPAGNTEQDGGNR
ncbi:MAG: RNA polymerase sigma factor [Chloroflexi bacterium]|nr:RNA polymerase sigma factor [Chloroflexota bacterium]MBU1752003.1 RNA polymerase sigma factor [Chloroflexota bacterium]